MELFYLDKVGQAGLLLAGDQLLQLLCVLLIHPSGQDDQKWGLIRYSDTRYHDQNSKVCLIKHYYFSYTLVIKMIKSVVFNMPDLISIIAKIYTLHLAQDYENFDFCYLRL